MPFVHVDDIPDQGRHFAADLTTDWAAAAAELALDVRPLDLRIDLTARLVADPTRPRVRDTIRVDGRVEARFPTSCTRCLRQIEVQLAGPVQLLYTRPGATTEEDVALDEGELELGWLDKGRLDMAVPVSEQLALLGRSRYRCSDAGVARAEADPTPCALPPQAPVPELRRANPFAALAKLDLPE